MTHSGQRAAGSDVAASAVAQANGISCAPRWLWPALCGLTAIYLALAFYRISDIPLLDPDEPRYAAAGRAMARGGSLLVPEFNGQPRINKPPLFYWLVAASDKLCGTAAEISARLPSILMGAIMLWGTVWLGCRVFNPNTGLLAGLILITSPLFMALSRCCITDMTLSTFMAGALAWIMLGMLGLAPPRRALWIGAALLGLAVLTKATAALAIVLPVVIERAISIPAPRRPALLRYLPWMLAAAMLLSYAALWCDEAGKKSPGETPAAVSAKAEDESAAGSGPQRLSAGAAGNGIHVRQKQFWQTLDAAFKYSALILALCAVGFIVLTARRAESLAGMPWRAGLALALAAGVWWYAALIVNQGITRFWELLKFEVGQRLAGGMHREPMFYYLPLSIALLFPWSLGLIGAVGSAWPAGKSAVEENIPRQGERFLLAWPLGIIFFFSIPGAKLATYILPAMPATALLLARFILRLGGEEPAVPAVWKKVSLIFTALVALMFVAAPLFLHLLPRDFSDMERELPLPLWALATPVAIIFPGGWLLAHRGKWKAAALTLSAAMLLLIFAGVPMALPTLNKRSSRETCARIKEGIAGCARVVSLGVAVESLSYYLDHPVVELQWKRPPDKTGAGAATARAALLSEELGKEEKTALLINKRYFKALFGTEANQLSPQTIPQFLPPEAECVYLDAHVLVLKSRR